MTFRKAVAILFAMVLGLVGCDKGEKPVAVTPAPSSPESYMNDKPFLDGLKKQDAARNDMRRRHAALRRELKKLEDAKSTDARVQEIKAELGALERDFKASRQQTLATVRKRLTEPKAADKTPDRK